MACAPFGNKFYSLEWTTKLCWCKMWLQFNEIKPHANYFNILHQWCFDRAEFHSRWSTLITPHKYIQFDFGLRCCCCSFYLDDVSFFSLSCFVFVKFYWDLISSHIFIECSKFKMYNHLNHLKWFFLFIFFFILVNKDWSIHSFVFFW